MKKDATLVIAIVLAALGYTGYHQFQGKPSITLDTKTASEVVWDKPTTDEKWADDVKAESLDTRSTAVLNTMIVAHTGKLQKEIKANKKYQECPECIYYDYYQQFTDNGMDDATAKAEATSAASTSIAQHQWSVEKLQQSIERMNKEVELRAKGFVIVDGEAKPTFGATVPPNRIRHIRD